LLKGKQLKSRVSAAGIFFAFLCASFFFLCIYIFNYGTMLSFNSDSATANLLAGEQIIEGRFFPKNWFYAQDIWLFGINNYIVIINNFINNELMSRYIAVFIQSLILGSLIYSFITKFFRNKLMAIIFLSIIFSGVSSLFVDMFYGQAPYGAITVCIFLTLFLYYLILNNNYDIKKKILLYSAFMFLFAYLNVGGPRFIFILTIPLLGSLAISKLLENPTNIKIDRKTILIILFSFLGTVLGLLIYKKLTGSLQYVAGVVGTSFSGYDQLFNNMKLFVLSMLYLFDALPETYIQITSIQGLLQIYKVIIMLVVMFIIPIVMLCHYKRFPNNIQFILWFYIISFLSTSYLYLFGTISSNSIATARYFLVSQFFAIFISVFYLVNMINKVNKKIWISFIIITILPLLLSSYQLTFKHAFSITSDKSIVRNEHPKRAITEYLIDHNLKYGYASYWNAGVTTVLSNNEVFITAINIPSVTPFYWLSSKRWYQSSNFEGKTFILLDKNESEQIDYDNLKSILGDTEEILTYLDYKILVYNYNISAKLPGWLND
jgi:hypothetical protein